MEIYYKRMGNKNNTIIFVEKLTFFVWIFHLIRKLINIKQKKKFCSKIYYIDISLLAQFILRLVVPIFSVTIEKLEFVLSDIKDEKGNFYHFNGLITELKDIQSKIFENPLMLLVRRQEKEREGFHKLIPFLKKQCVLETNKGINSVQRVLFILHIILWKTKQEYSDQRVDKVFFTFRSCFWIDELKNFARSHRIEMIFMKNPLLNIKNILFELFDEFRVKAVYYFIVELLSGKRAYARKNSLNDVISHETKLLTEYWGHLNLDRPGLFSDLFFFQMSSVEGKNMALAFNLSDDPIDAKKYAILEEENITAIALSPNATRVRNVLTYIYWPKKKDFDFRFFEKCSCSANNKKWVKKQIKYFFSHVDYWENLFKKNNIKVFLSWFSFDARSHIISEALNRLNGVTAIYQRAYKDIPTVSLGIDVDVKFGFSKFDAEIEKQSGSSIKYFIVTGHLGDHRIPYLQKYAKNVRDGLMKNGARHIISYFDENSTDDSRWHTGHEFMRDNYEFLLRKVITESWFGLVLKPKNPITLKKRLGNLSTLLLSAQKTGRCYLFEGGIIQGSFPPSVAALAADIAVHGHLHAATAGVEAILAGIPTVFIDREGVPLSSFYRIKKGKVIFKDWVSFWDMYIRYYKNQKKFFEFGNCSEILDALDPFRDGKAAKRMGEYLCWIIEGYNQNLSKETILELASERYKNIWGKDMVFSV